VKIKKMIFGDKNHLSNKNKKFNPNVLKKDNLKNLKLTNMKKATILKSLSIVTLLFIGFIGMYAQNLTVNAESLRNHGTNAAGTPVAYEATDSVTTGSVMRYYNLPDATANPAYVSPLGGTLASSFAWTTTGATETAAGTIAEVTGQAAFGNYRQVTWAGAGTINLNVQETTPAPANCDGALTTIPVAIIPIPTATFGANPAAVCVSSPVQTFTLPVTLTTAVNDGWVRINYTVYNPDATELIAAQDLDINESATDFDVTLTGATQYGNYYVIINSVTDRISRKPVVDVTGTITNNRIDMYVYRTPVTGPIYHVPNM
jgi:hypothetical protein